MQFSMPKNNQIEQFSLQKILGSENWKSELNSTDNSDQMEFSDFQKFLRKEP